MEKQPFLHLIDADRPDARKAVCGSKVLERGQPSHVASKTCPDCSGRAVEGKHYYGRGDTAHDFSALFSDRRG